LGGGLAAGIVLAHDDDVFRNTRQAGEQELRHSWDHGRGTGGEGLPSGRGEVVCRQPVTDDDRLLPVEDLVELSVAGEHRARHDERDAGVVGELRAALRARTGVGDAACDDFERTAGCTTEFGIDVGDGGVDTDRVLGEERLVVGVADLDRTAGSGAGLTTGVLQRQTFTSWDAAVVAVVAAVVVAVVAGVVAPVVVAVVVVAVVPAVVGAVVGPAAAVVAAAEAVVAVAAEVVAVVAVLVSLSEQAASNKPTAAKPAARRTCLIFKEIPLFIVKSDAHFGRTSPIYCV